MHSSLLEKSCTITINNQWLQYSNEPLPKGLPNDLSIQRVVTG